MDEGANGLMADTLIAGTTLIEKESRSIGDIPVGGIIEWDDTFNSLPNGFNLCDGSTITDPLSSYNGSAIPNYNTNYYSLIGAQFNGINPDTSNISYQNTNGYLQADSDGIICVAHVTLPQGAIVTSVEGYSNVSDENISLKRMDTSSGASTILTAPTNFNTAQETITNETIENSTYSYHLFTSSIDTGVRIYGALIKYTPRQKFIIRIK